MLFGFVSIEELEEFWEFIDGDCFEKSVVVVFQLFFPLLDEGFFGGAEEFPGGEDRQLIFELAFFAVDM